MTKKETKFIAMIEVQEDITPPPRQVKNGDKISSKGNAKLLDLKIGLVSCQNMI